MEAVECSGEVLGHRTEKVAGHNEDFKAAGAIEHVFREACICQLIVM